MDRYDSLVFLPFSRPLSGLLALPSLAAFFHKQDDDRQGGDAIDPPPARHEQLYEQSDYDDAGEIATSDRRDSIGAERAASDLIGNSYFGAGSPQATYPDCTLRTALARSPPARAALPVSTSAFESALP